ncbi:hypothetical protein BBK36DRAFT_1172840 [Trichoderma citrinoviride]|uniref:Uncharacterized protein n=1 Tax=Trichoderma citrinoviride TaxID=58853 RepID=A0A2T4AZ03_9HYPO|nr:hypothetical protein BBK36DRAFT_1172840 [Trichoderma citrinoviride]PTB62294.1 hypothetical protein BBK36DRAFT_1172840 [Trichoderma citrinoviride]
MRASVILAGLASLVAAAPSVQISAGDIPAGEIGIIFTYTNGSQSAQTSVANSISQVPLNSGGIVDNVFVHPPSNPAVPGHYLGASCAFLDFQSRGLGVGHVNGPGIIILESKDVIEYVQCNTD